MWLNRVDPAALGVEGQLLGSMNEVIAKFAQTAIRAGLVVQRGTAVDQITALTVLPAAAPTAILIGPFAPVVAGQTLTDVAGAPGGVLNGVVGPGRIFPPRSITYTFSAHANWGLAALGGTWCHTLGLGPSGHLQKEDWFLPAGGNIVVSTNLAYSKHLATYVGACDGAGGGTGTIGLSNDNVVLGRLDYGIAVYDRAIEPSAVATVTYDIPEPVPVLLDGTMCAVVETTAALAVAAGDPVAVRVVQAGLDVRGQLTRYTSPVMGNFALLDQAEWITGAAAGGLALVRIWR